MSVIAFPNLAPQGPEASMSWELRSLTAINRSPLNAVATTLERPGAHWAVRMPYQNLAADRRARLQAFVSSARGHAQRFYVPVYGWTRRGSFPATELLTNNTFASGTTGWTGDVGAATSLSAADGVLRLTRTAGGSGSTVYAGQTVAVTQYAPYAMRVLTHFASPGETDYGATLTGAVAAFGDTPGLRTAVGVSESTSINGYIDHLSDAGAMASAYREVSYTSLARCALVDNGPNVLTRSDEIDNVAWTKSNCTVNADQTAAPNGTNTAESMVENSATGFHNFTQAYIRTAAAESWCGYVDVKRASGTRNVNVQIDDGTGQANCTFDLGAGTAGTPGSGGGVTNPRAFIVDRGDGWYRCFVVGQLQSTTTARLTVFMDNGAAQNYTGDGSSSIYVWRAGLARSGVPTRGMQTTSAGDSDGTSQTGGALYLKGLPASTSGLLLQGDPAEIIIGSTSQLVRTRAPLNSDASGLGYFEFEPPIRISPSDNAAVIIHNPMCRMMMENNVNGWTDRLGGFSDLEFAAMEDTYP